MADRARPVGLIGAPSARASRAYRVILGTTHTIGRGVFGFRVEVRGRHHLPRDASGRPAGGWIAAGLPHRTWVDPFVVADCLPVEPRLVFFGDGAAIFRSGWRRWLVGRVGGVIPIWPGGDRASIDGYIAAASSALDAGAVLCLFPETGPAMPPGTARPFGAGLAYFALRTGAPIVPLVLGGTHELYRGRRLRLDALAPVTWQELAEVPPESPPPDPWSSAERRIAHRVTFALHERTADAVARAHVATIPGPGVAIARAVVVGRAADRPSGDARAARAHRRRRRSRPPRHGPGTRCPQALGLVDDRVALTADRNEQQVS